MLQTLADARHVFKVKVPKVLLLLRRKLRNPVLQIPRQKLRGYRVESQIQT